MTCPDIRFIYGPPAYDTGDNVPSGVETAPADAV